MNVQVNIQSLSDEPAPEDTDIRRWICAALHKHPEDTDITVRIVGIDEMTTLNQTYRGKTGPTNVLSFPSDLPAELQLPLLGDIVICAPVVAREATEQNKPAIAHWAHMTVHGTLHLLGYDHQEEAQALAMESLETAILATLDYPCPYRTSSATEHPI